MVRKSAGNKPDETPEEKLKRIEQARVNSAKRSINSLETSELEEFSLQIDRELSTREPERDTNADLLPIDNIFDDIEHASKTWGKVGGISTGYDELDGMIGGLKDSEVTLIAGESNNGKSAFIANIVSRVAQETPTLYVTLEMQPRSVGARLKYTMGGGDEYKQLKIQFQKTFKIDYRSLEPLFAKAKAAGCKVAVLDYLQYMGVGMRNEEVAIMSRVMCGLAMTYDIPFLIVVSLRKSDGKRKWTNITLEDIMGTGAIGYDADNVLLVSRRDNDDSYDRTGIWVKHLKSRDMPVDYDNPYLRFLWDKTRIESDVDYYDEQYSSMYKAATEKYLQEQQPQQQDMLAGGEAVDPKTTPFK